VFLQQPEPAGETSGGGHWVRHVVPWCVVCGVVMIAPFGLLCVVVCCPAELSLSCWASEFRKSSEFLIFRLRTEERTRQRQRDRGGAGTAQHSTAYSVQRNTTPPDLAAHHSTR
jgi:hypothetical protein